MKHKRNIKNSKILIRISKKGKEMAEALASLEGVTVSEFFRCLVADRLVSVKFEDRFETIVKKIEKLLEGK